MTWTFCLALDLIFAIPVLPYFALGTLSNVAGAAVGRSDARREFAGGTRLLYVRDNYDLVPYGRDDGELPPWLAAYRAETGIEVRQLPWYCGTTARGRSFSFWEQVADAGTAGHAVGYREEMRQLVLRERPGALSELRVFECSWDPMLIARFERCAGVPLRPTSVHDAEELRSIREWWSRMDESD